MRGEEFYEEINSNLILVPFKTNFSGGSSVLAIDTSRGGDHFNLTKISQSKYDETRVGSNKKRWKRLAHNGERELVRVDFNSNKWKIPEVEYLEVLPDSPLLGKNEMS